mmetsp:Transcript_96585/g.215245  ORF Transcript_96585/g.215245 Transcript_96585/m.215245 type:complete len:256 (-) Transcript_96585:8-775(-)
MGNASCAAAATEHLNTAACSEHAPNITCPAPCGNDDLIDRKYINVQLLAGARDGEPSIVREAIKSGANTETRQPMRIIAGPRQNPSGSRPRRSKGPTPLMLAAKSGSGECVRILLAAGARLNAKDEDGMRPVHFAAESGELEVLKILLGARADPTTRDGDDLDATGHLHEEVRRSPRHLKAWLALLDVPGGKDACEARQEPDGSGPAETMEGEPEDEEDLEDQDAGAGGAVSATAGSKRRPPQGEQAPASPLRRV